VAIAAFNDCTDSAIGAIAADTVVAPLAIHHASAFATEILVADLAAVHVDAMVAKVLVAECAGPWVAITLPTKLPRAVDATEVAGRAAFLAHNSVACLAFRVADVAAGASLARRLLAIAAGHQAGTRVGLERRQLRAAVDNLLFARAAHRLVRDRPLQQRVGQLVHKALHRLVVFANRIIRWEVSLPANMDGGQRAPAAGACVWVALVLRQRSVLA